MLHFKKEGQILHQGLSIYHPRDPHSAGAYLRLGNHILRLRWSKVVKKFFIGYNRVDPNILKQIDQWEIENRIK